MNINLEHYRVFYYVGKTGAITQAAEHLSISQPAVNQTLKQLEQQLGTVLFVRTAKGVRFTAEGEMLYSYVARGDECIRNGEDKLMQLLVYNPRKRFRIPVGNDFSIWDMKQTYIIEPEEQFMSMGKSTPFSGWRVWGKCLATVCDGKLVLMDKVRK